MKSYKRIISVHFDFDGKFLALLPAVNINFHSKTLEFEFLFFAIYIDFLHNIGDQ